MIVEGDLCKLRKLSCHPNQISAEFCIIHFKRGFIDMKNEINISGMNTFNSVGLVAQTLHTKRLSQFERTSPQD